MHYNLSQESMYDGWRVLLPFIKHLLENKWVVYSSLEKDLYADVILKDSIGPKY